MWLAVLPQHTSTPTANPAVPISPTLHRSSRFLVARLLTVGLSWLPTSAPTKCKAIPFPTAPSPSGLGPGRPRYGSPQQKVA